jgi:phage-related protein
MGRKAPHGRRRQAQQDKPLAWMAGELKTPPMSSDARVEGGMLLRRLQRGETLSIPDSRPMATIGTRCHELRIGDIAQKKEWRIIYYVGNTAIAVLEVFAKDTRTTPDDVIRTCKRRLADFKAKDGS